MKESKEKVGDAKSVSENSSYFQSFLLVDKVVCNLDYLILLDLASLLQVHVWIVDENP